MSSRPPSGPQQVPTWSLRASAVIDVILLVLGTSLLWGALTLLGLLVAGIAPASVAACEVMRRHRSGMPPQIARTMWTQWRTELIPATLRMAPFLLWQLGGLTTLWLAVSGQVPAAWMSVPLAAVAAASLGWATCSAAAVASVPAIRRMSTRDSWRSALLCPGAVPGASTLLILLLLVLCLLVSGMPILGILLGPGVAALAATRILGVRAEALLDSFVPTVDEGLTTA